MRIRSAKIEELTPKPRERALSPASAGRAPARGRDSEGARTTEVRRGRHRHRAGPGGEDPDDARRGEEGDRRLQARHEHGDSRQDDLPVHRPLARRPRRPQAEGKLSGPAPRVAASTASRVSPTVSHDRRSPMTRRRRVRRRHAVALFLALSLLVFGAIWQNVLGVGDEVTGTLHNFARRVALLVDPPPDRPIADTVLVTPRPAEPRCRSPVADRSRAHAGARRDAHAGPDAHAEAAARQRRRRTCSSTPRTTSSARSSTTPGVPSPGRRWSSRCTARRR